MRSVKVGLIVVVGSVWLASSASAQTAAAPTVAPAAPPPAAAPPSAAPDVVRLKNGGMLRGTIAESEPGQSVTIVLLTGETRKVPFADVEYAGPAASAPSAAPAPAPASASPAPFPGASNGTTQPFAVVHAEEARVDFVSAPTGESLFRRSNTAAFASDQGSFANGYEEVCTAPCNVSMPAGTHTFAIAKPGSRAIEAEPVTLPPGNSTLSATYADKTGVRVGLVVLGALGIVGGLGLELSAISASKGEDSFDTGPLVGGILLQAGGTGLLLAGAFIKDRVTLTLSPGAGAPPLPSPGTAAPTPPKGQRPANLFTHYENETQRGESASSRLQNGLLGLTLSARF